MWGSERACDKVENSASVTPTGKLLIKNLMINESRQSMFFHQKFSG